MGRKVFLRADASSVIGYGHFVRSLALASMLKDEFDCTFFSRDVPETLAAQCKDVCPLVSLPSGDESLEHFLSLLSGEETVVLDNYFYTDEYRARVRSRCHRLVCMDDMHTGKVAADMIVSQCLTDSSLYDGLLEDGTLLCMGPRHALLRPPFLEPVPRRERKYDYLLCFGGSVFAAELCRHFSTLTSGRPTAVVSSFPELELDGADVYGKLSDRELCSLMDQSRIVVCSASGVCYEALSRGCHVMAGWYMDNQKEFYRSLCDSSLVTPLGYLHSCSSLDLPETAEADFSFAAGIPQFYRKLFSAIDFKIVNYIDLDPEQSAEVWRVRNLPQIRCRMNNPEEFSFAFHKSFITSLNQRDDRVFLAVYDGGRFVGHYNFINIDPFSHKAERGLFLAPEYQGRGLGERLEALMECYIARRGVRILEAQVLLDNEPSIRFHQKSGYLMTGKDDRHVYFSKHII